jgi:hypothetical protein
MDNMCCRRSCGGRSRNRRTQCSKHCVLQLKSHSPGELRDREHGIDRLYRDLREYGNDRKHWHRNYGVDWDLGNFREHGKHAMTDRVSSLDAAPA